MAVGATDIALRDFEEDSIPRLMHSEEDDVVALRGRIAMVKVEYDNVRLSAVDAGMSSEVLADERTILVAVSTDSRDFLLDVRVAIADVVPAPVLRVTCATAALPSAFGLIGERERVDRLDESAVIATLGGDRRKKRHEGTSEVGVGPSLRLNEPLEHVFYHVLSKQSRPARE